MSINLTGFGLVRVITDTVYHRLMREITGYEYDLVGFYYMAISKPKAIAPGQSQLLTEKRGEYMVILYDVVTGVVTSKSSLSWSSLCRDPMVKSIIVNQIIPEEGKKKKVEVNFQTHLTGLISERVKVVPDFRHREVLRLGIRNHILKALGDNSEIVTAYNNINSILILLDESNQKPDYHTFNYCSYIAKPVTYSPFSYNQGETEAFRLEVIIMLDVIRDLLYMRRDFVDRIISSINPRIENDDDIPYIVTVPGEERKFENSDTVHRLLILESRMIQYINSREYSSADVTIREMNNLRDEISDEPHLQSLAMSKTMGEIEKRTFELRNIMVDMTRKLNSDAIPIINVGDMINGMNRLCMALAIDKIDGEDLIQREGSYRSLLIVGNNNMESIPVDIQLATGESIILPSINADVSNIDTDTLNEILNHLNSVEFSEKRFNSLKSIVTREIAMRRMSEKPS